MSGDALVHGGIVRADLAAAGLLLVMVLAGLNLRRGMRAQYRSLQQRPHLVPIVAFAPVLLALYLVAILHGVLFFSWYAAPFAPFWIAALVFAASALPARLLRLWPGLAVFMCLWMIAGYRWSDRPVPLSSNLSRERDYALAAHFFNGHLTSDDVVALPEIGVFGYDTQAYVLDAVGLVSPRALKYYPLPASLESGDIPPALVHDLNPKYIVTPNRYLPRALERARWFHYRYRRVARFWTPDATWGETWTEIFERRRGIIG